MDEPAKPLSPSSFRCESHNLRHGPSGCPICQRALAPEPVVLLPVQDSSLSGLDAVAGFWRRYGMKSVGLLALGLGSIYSLAWPSPTRAIDPAPYQRPIVDLESVLFYSGPTDPEAHQKMLVTLLPAVVSSIKARPPAYRADFLIGVLEELQSRVKYADLEGFRLTGVRRTWVQIREDFFDDAVWFRLRDDQLDAVQNRLQGDLPPGALNTAGLDALDSYYRGVEAFVARASYLASQACIVGADKSAITGEFRSLSTDTMSQLDAIVAGSEGNTAQLAVVISQARTLVRGRKDQACGAGVPSAPTLDSEFSAFKRAVEGTRARLNGTAAH